MRKLINYLICLMAILWAVPSAYGQKGQLKGTVISSKDRLEGVTVIIEKSKIGTVTNLDGYFEISNIDTGKQQVKIDYMGFKSALLSVYIKENETFDAVKFF